MASIEDLYIEIAQIDEHLARRDAATDSARYWREGADLKERQRSLWERIAERAVEREEPEWARRAAFLATMHCRDWAERFAQCERQCAKEER